MNIPYWLEQVLAAIAGIVIAIVYVIGGTWAFMSLVLWLSGGAA